MNLETVHPTSWLKFEMLQMMEGPKVRDEKDRYRTCCSVCHIKFGEPYSQSLVDMSPKNDESYRKRITKQ